MLLEMIKGFPVDIYSFEVTLCALIPCESFKLIVHNLSLQVSILLFEYLELGNIFLVTGPQCSVELFQLLDDQHGFCQFPL